MQINNTNNNNNNKTLYAKVNNKNKKKQSFLPFNENKNCKYPKYLLFCLTKWILALEREGGMKIII